MSNQFHLSSDDKALADKLIKAFRHKDKSPWAKLNASEKSIMLKFFKLIQDGHPLPLDWMWELDYREKPVDPETFLFDPYYYGKQIHTVWKPWIDELLYVLNPKNNIQEWIMAGCFTGDTKIQLLDGATPTLKELAENNATDFFYVYSCDSEGNIVPGLAHSPRITKRRSKLVQVVLDKGQIIRCTPDHRFLLQTGDYCRADELSPGVILKSRIENSHKVSSITPIDALEDVYDITVEEHHNFMLDAGVVVHNSAGCGKTSISVIAQAYKLYCLSLLRDPQAFFKLQAGSLICFGLFNTTISKTDLTSYYKFENLLTNVPYFRERFPIKKRTRDRREEEYIQLPRDVRLVAGSRAIHAVSLDIYGAILDEQSQKDGKKAIPYKDSSAYTLYTEAMNRIRNRFGRKGAPVLLISISSAGTDASFLTEHIEKRSSDQNTHISEMALWEADTESYKDSMWFQVAVGNRDKPSRILEQQEDIANQRVISVPEDHRQDFERDLDGALRDFAGVATIGKGRLLSRPDRLTSCFTLGDTLGLKHPFAHFEVELSLDDPTPLRDLFLWEQFFRRRGYSKKPIRNPNAPRFIHVDLAKSQDCAGIGMSHVSSRSLRTSKGPGGYGVVEHYIPVVELDFALRIKPPKQGQIDFQKILDFILDLKSLGNLNIEHVGYDGYQSTHSLQILEKNGFNCSEVSLDRSGKHYFTFRDTIHEQRFISYTHPLLEEELPWLVVDGRTGKVDHVAGKKKDTSDGVCGSVAKALEYESKAGRLYDGDGAEFPDADKTKNSWLYQEYIEDVRELHPTSSFNFKGK